MSKPASTRTFKERLDSLSELVEKLEGGELSLEEAIQRFEDGRRLHRELMAELAGYEKRLEKLVQGAEEGPGSAPENGPAPGGERGGPAHG